MEKGDFVSFDEKPHQFVGTSRATPMGIKGEDLPGVFSGIDIQKKLAKYEAVDVGKRVVVADARKAAQSINQFLTGKEVVGEESRFSSYPGNLGTLPPEMFAAFKAGTRKEIDLLPVNKRLGNFNEVEQHCSKTEMAVEAKRCLECGCNVADICLLKKHSQTYQADQLLFEGARRTFKTDYSHEKIKIETHKCINCNACVRACEEVKKCNILGNTGRGFSTRIAPMMNMPLSQTHCDGCEECVNVCPTAGVRLNREVYLMKVHG